MAWYFYSIKGEWVNPLTPCRSGEISFHPTGVNIGCSELDVFLFDRDDAGAFIQLRMVLANDFAANSVVHDGATVARHQGQQQIAGHVKLDLDGGDQERQFHEEEVVDVRDKPALQTSMRSQLRNRITQRGVPHGNDIHSQVVLLTGHADGAQTIATTQVSANVSNVVRVKLGVGDVLSYRR